MNIRQLRLHDDCVEKTLYAASRKRNRVHLEQIKWTKLLRKRQKLACSKEAFRAHPFIASVRWVPSLSYDPRCAATYRLHTPVRRILPQNVLTVKDRDRRGCCSSEEWVHGGQVRSSGETSRETQTPNMRCQTQLDPGVPSHTFALVVNCLVSRTIDEECVSKKSLALPAKISKLLTVRLGA